MSDNDTKADIQILLEIEPFDETELLEDKPAIGLDTDPTINGLQRVNPSTGLLETVIDSSMEEAEYLDLDEKPDSAVRKVKRRKKLRKRRKLNEGLWQNTSTEEWMNVYRRYMEERTRELSPPTQWGRGKFEQYESDENTDFSEMYTYLPYIDSCDTEKRKTSVSETNDTPMKQEEFLHQEESNSQEEKTDCHPDSSGSEFEDVEYLEDTPASHLDRDKEKIIKRNMRQLQNNSIKLLKFSNLCLFKYEMDYLQCFHCQQRFKHMSMLRAHSKTNHNYKRIRCIIDSEQYHNADITDLECSICNRSLDSLNELQNHLKTHEIKFKIDGSTLVPFRLCSGAFKCQRCGVETTSLCQLHGHMRRHVLKHFCLVCGSGFSSYSSLKLHEIVCGRSKCNFCESTFQNDSERKSHESAEHGGVLKITSLRFKCSYCRQRFRHNYLRQQHIVEKHRRGADLYQCRYCPKTFMTAHWCSKHTTSVHADELYENSKR